MAGRRAHLTFLLNGHMHRVADIDPTTTLLQWLRRTQRLTGTKEGCAEGDCGACTVVVGTLFDGAPSHRAINACIAFLPMLEGTSITTVEGVAAANGALHPCQQALVDTHGSQCGFCTPGFVMSLFAMYSNENAAPAPAAIDDALAGNLCRCTGYGQIVAAAQKMFDLPRPVTDSARRTQEYEQLAAIQHADTIDLTHDGRRVVLPATEDDLAQIYLAHSDATLIAGATDVGLWVTKQARPLPLTIHTARVRELAGHAVTPAEPHSRVVLGAAMTHTDALRVLGPHSPALAELWRRFAGAQIRNAGTIGGNIANGSPIGDLAPVLIAIGATLHLRRGDERRAISLEDFFIAYGRQDRRPGEFITGIEIPSGNGGWRDVTCHKISKRFDDDISAVCGAFNITIENGLIASARIAFGGMAAIPKRASAVETALLGQPFTRRTIDRAMPAFEQDFTPISDARASSAYRMQVAKNLLVRVLVERSAPHLPTRLVGAAALAIGGHDAKATQ